jgi:hypothetical protein
MRADPWLGNCSGQRSNPHTPERVMSAEQTERGRVLPFMVAETAEGGPPCQGAALWYRRKESRPSEEAVYSCSTI